MGVDMSEILHEGRKGDEETATFTIRELGGAMSGIWPRYYQ